MTTGFDILTGVGTLWVAPQGTAFPLVNALPVSPWRFVGETEGGVKFTWEQTLATQKVDQETGILKAWRTDENVTLETALSNATLENLQMVLGGSSAVVQVAPVSGVVGTKYVQMYRGSTVSEVSVLFRGFSPYGDGTVPAQYELIRAYFDGTTVLDHLKGDNVKIAVKFTALVNLAAGGDADKFGRLVAQYLPALP